MKPTTESIEGAIDCALQLWSKADSTRVQLAIAKAYFESDCAYRCIQTLTAARSHIAQLRRTQMAALRHIDNALQSARGGEK
jgi:hypothetical protein